MIALLEFPKLGLQLLKLVRIGFLIYPTEWLFPGQDVVGGDQYLANQSHADKPREDNQSKTAANPTTSGSLMGARLHSRWTAKRTKDDAF
jgi:hypothetical protein